MDKEALLSGTDKYYYIKRVYNKDNQLSLVQVLDERDRIAKCLFYDDNKRLSNVCIYNTITGKEIKNITYRADGKTVSSIRTYDSISGIPLNVIFYKNDGKKISSVIQYGADGNEAKFSLYCDDGEIISSAI